MVFAACATGALRRLIVTPSVPLKVLPVTTESLPPTNSPVPRLTNSGFAGGLSVAGAMKLFCHWERGCERAKRSLASLPVGLLSSDPTLSGSGKPVHAETATAQVMAKCPSLHLIRKTQPPQREEF